MLTGLWSSQNLGQKKITQKVGLVNMFIRISLGTQTSTGIVINECIGIRLNKFVSYQLG